jgi:hypothetical protein
MNVNTRLCYAFGVFLSTPIRCDMSGAVLRRVEPNAAGGLEDRSQNLCLKIFAISAGLPTPLPPRFATRVWIIAQFVVCLASVAFR